MLSTSQQQQSDGGPLEHGKVHGNAQGDTGPTAPGDSSSNLPREAFQAAVPSQDTPYIHTDGNEYHPDLNYAGNSDLQQEEEDRDHSQDDLQVDLSSYSIQQAYGQGHPETSQGYHPHPSVGSDLTYTGTNTLVVQQPPTSDESTASSQNSYSGNAIQVIIHTVTVREQEEFRKYGVLWQLIFYQAN